MDSEHRACTDAEEPGAEQRHRSTSSVHFERSDRAPNVKTRRAVLMCEASDLSDARFEHRACVWR